MHVIASDRLTNHVVGLNTHYPVHQQLTPYPHNHDTHNRYWKSEVLGKVQNEDGPFAVRNGSVILSYGSIPTSKATVYSNDELI